MAYAGPLKAKRRRSPDLRLFCGMSGDQLLSATFLPRCAARSLSITVRQPALNCARCFIMQAVIAGMFGMSELHSLKASPVHCARASSLKAKLCVDDSADSDSAKPRTRPAWRTLSVKVAVIISSHWPRLAGPLFDGETMRRSRTFLCDNSHSETLLCDTNHLGPIRR